MAKLSIVVPIYNEAHHLEQVIQVLMGVQFPLEVEWIFVDDHSTDGSTEILKKLQIQHSFKGIYLEQNFGKGFAVRQGFTSTTGDFVMIQDADFEYDPKDAVKLIEPLMKNEADVVYGSRFKKNSPQVHRTYHYFVNRLLTFLSNLLSGIYLSDMETCYKVFRAEIVKAMNLRSLRFGIEVELTAYISKIRVRMCELPISYFPRNRLQGKKISWKDGLAALYHLVRFNLFTNADKAFTHLSDRYRL